MKINHALVKCCGFTFLMYLAMSVVMAQPLSNIHTLYTQESEQTLGRVVTTQGIVTAVMQQNYAGSLKGFFIQNPDDAVDNDPHTSEAIFVYCGNDCYKTPVLEGQSVKVTGIVERYFGAMQIKASMVSVVNSEIQRDAITPIRLTQEESAWYENKSFFLKDLSDLKRYENMLVQANMIVADTYELPRYGHLLMSTKILRQFTQHNRPDSEKFLAQQAEDRRHMIYLDNIDNVQNSKEIPFLTTDSSGKLVVPKVNDTAKLYGVLHWSFAGSGSQTAWRIRPTQAVPVYQKSSDLMTLVPYTAQPAFPPPGQYHELKIASFNVLNYFNGTNLGTVFPTSRGAKSAQEFARQTQKIVLDMERINADIYGLMEIENDAIDGKYSAVASLVNALNQHIGEERYRYIDAGQIGKDEITQAIIYRFDRVKPIGKAIIFDDPDFIAPNGATTPRNRPSLIQTFSLLDYPDEMITLSVNHLKSKSSSCGQHDDDLLTGQGNCNLTRTLAAEKLATFLATQFATHNVLIIGDLNAYYYEDPITTLNRLGFSHVLNEYDYTYVFKGYHGALDHMLANRVLGSKWMYVMQGMRNNSLYSTLLDYKDDILDSGEKSYEVKPHLNFAEIESNKRASDHDSLVIKIFLCEKTQQCVQKNIEEERKPIPDVKQENDNVMETNAQNSAIRSNGGGTMNWFTLMSLLIVSLFYSCRKLFVLCD